MLLRFGLTLLIILIGLALFLAFRSSQIRRFNSRGGLTAPAQTPALIFFSSRSCTPCLAQDTYLEGIKPELKQGFFINKIDVEENQELASQLGVLTLPTTMLVDRSGIIRHINYGLTTTTKLEGQLENYS